MMRMTAFFVVFRSKARRRERKTYSRGNDNKKYESFVPECLLLLRTDEWQCREGWPRETDTHLVGMTMGGGKV